MKHINMCGKLHVQAQAQCKWGAKRKRWEKTQSILSVTVSPSPECATYCALV